MIAYPLMLIGWGSVAPTLLQRNLNYKLGGYGHLHTRLKEIPQLDSIDILFLGSSHTYRGFDTRIFDENGFKSFNLGSSSQSPLQTEILLDRYLDRIKPKLIVYEVGPSIFDTDGVESTLDLLANDQIDQQIIDLAFKQNNLKVYNNLLYGLYRSYFKLDDNFQEEVVKDNDRYIKGGYVEREIEYFSPRKMNPIQWKFRSEQLKAFERIVQKVKAADISLLLLQAPITKSKYNAYLGMNEFDARMKYYGNYLNFNDLSKVEDRLHFYDDQHLNQSGVALFNTDLIQFLKDK